MIKWLGEDNQSLPVMILKTGSTSQQQTGFINGHAFITNKDAILATLTERHNFPLPHP